MILVGKGEEMNWSVKNPNLIEYCIDLRDKDLCKRVITQSMYYQLYGENSNFNREALSNLTRENFIIEDHQTILGLELMDKFVSYCMTKSGRMRKHPMKKKFQYETKYLEDAKKIRDCAYKYGWEKVYEKVPERCFDNGGQYLACIIEKEHIWKLVKYW